MAAADEIDLSHAALELGMSRSSRECFELATEQSKANESQAEHAQEWELFKSSPERRAISFEDIANAIAQNDESLLKLPLPTSHSRSKSLDSILWPDEPSQSQRREKQEHASASNDDDDNDDETGQTSAMPQQLLELQALPMDKRLEALQDLEASLREQNIALRYEHDDLSMQVSEVRNRKAILKGQLAAKNAGVTS